MNQEELATKIAFKITGGDEVPITVHSKSLISLTRGFEALVKCILEVLDSQETEEPNKSKEQPPKCAKCGAKLIHEFVPSGSGPLEVFRCPKGCNINQGLSPYLTTNEAE